MTAKKAVKKQSKKAVKKQSNNLPEVKGQMQIEMNPQALVSEAIKQNASLDTINKLLDLSERIESKFAEKEFRSAMSQFQAECPIIKKSKIVRNSKEKGGGERYRYAPIDAIIKSVQPLIDKNGFSYRISTEITNEPKGIKTTITVSHIAGHSESTDFWVPIEPDSYMSEPQKWAAARTFGARYAFCDAFGILTGDEDNDANEKKDVDREAEKRKRDAIEKMNALPDNIKEGFSILGYTGKAAFIFCDKFGWNNQKIKVEIEKIVNAKEQ